MATSDFRPEVEITQFRTCALKNMTVSVIMESGVGQIPRSTERISISSNIFISVKFHGGPSHRRPHNQIFVGVRTP